MPEPNRPAMAGIARPAMLTTPAAVLLAIANKPGVTVKQLAARIGGSDRTVRRAIATLEDSGVLHRISKGNRNRYDLHLQAIVRLPSTQMTVAEFLERMR